MSAAVIIVRRRKFIRRFAERGATSPERAIRFDELGMRRSWIFQQMVSRGVFVPTVEDRYYMNESAAGEFLAAQQRRVRIITGVMLLLFLIFLLGRLVSRWFFAPA